MWKNYLKTSLRNLLRNRLYSVINIVGLTIGLAAVLLIGLYLRHELSYDRFHDNSERLYRMAYRQPDLDKRYDDGAVAPVAEQMLPRVPGIEAVTRVSEGGTQVFRDGDVFTEEIVYVETPFFRMFDLPALHGDPATFLDRPDGIVLTRQQAQKYFGDANPVGRTLQITLNDERREMVVQGVVGSWPGPSALPRGMFVPFSVRRQRIASMNDNMWGVVFSQTFVALEKGADRADVQAAIQGLDLQFEGDAPWSGYPAGYALQPLTTIHVNAFSDQPWPSHTSATVLRVLVGVGFVILLLACINFTTLTVGRSATRLREMAVRKVMGARRGDIRRLFWFETGLTVAVSMLLSVPLLEATMPLVRSFAGTGVALSYDLFFLTLLSGVALVTVLIAGFYPALIVSGFPVVASFRREVRVGGRGVLRRALVFVQVAVSVALLTVTLAMIAQMRYVQSRDLGYAGDQVVSLRATAERGLAARAEERIRAELAGDPGIESVAIASCTFGPDWNWVGWEESLGAREFSARLNTVDEHFLPTMGIELVEGRNWTSGPSDGRNGYIINETFAREMGWEQPVGMTVPEWFGQARVIGVVKDFHYQDLRSEIEPLLLIQTWDVIENNNWFSAQQYGGHPGFVLVRLSGEDIAGTMERLEGFWKHHVPESAFQASFVDEKVGARYEDYRRWNRVMYAAAMIAIVLTVLGLSGIAALQVARRTKEVGIRKVLGASVRQVLGLLSREVAVVVVLASLIAWPAAWFGLRRWLQDFAYRIDLSAGFFIGSGVAVLAVALGVVVLLSARVARTNPAHILRDE